MSDTDLGSNIGDEPNADVIAVVPKVRRKKAAPVAEAAAEAPKVAPTGMPDTVRIILEENEAIPPTGLFVSVNGKAYLISAGEEVNVPTFVLEVLDNAKMSMPVVATGGRVIGWRERHRYPYRRV